MRYSPFLFVAFISLVCLNPLHADAPAQLPQLTPEQMKQEADSLQYQTGKITLGDGLATLDLKPGYRFLDGPQSEKVLHDLWGNPPDAPPLGMVFPPNMGPLGEHGWSVVIEYEDAGHVNDSDAATTDWSKQLTEMQQAVKDENPQREQQGYPAMELVGWAEPPHYDATTHKLYWAKDLRVTGDYDNSLNYNVRVLGRKGVLDMDAIAQLKDLTDVKAQMPDLMTMVDFKAGNTYADFDPRVDKVAKYGIAALVAGTAVGVAAKVGLLKWLIPAIFALKKFAIIVVVAIGAGIKKLMSAIRGKSSVNRPFNPPGGDSPR